MASGKPRPFVKDNFDKGLACWVDANVVTSQLRYIEEKMNDTKVPLYLSTNDIDFAVHEQKSLKRHGVTGYLLGDFVTADMKINQDVYPVIDVTICSLAHTLVLNQYSTFSSGIYKQATWKQKDVVAYAWFLADFQGEKPMYSVGKFK
jgi:hypothetical protein